MTVTCAAPHAFLAVFFRDARSSRPIPGEEGHYKGFADVYGTTTDESHRPSLQKRSKKTKTLHLHPASSMWRMLTWCQSVSTVVIGGSCTVNRNSPKKKLQEALADVSLICGAPLQELELPGKLANVHVWDISCEEPIVWLYYTAKYPPIYLCSFCVWHQW